MSHVSSVRDKAIKTHPGVRLDLIGKENGDVELFGNLLQASEKLVEFLEE
jgi:hypothetical protein